MSLPIITAAMAFAEFFPAIKRLLGEDNQKKSATPSSVNEPLGRTLDVAEQVLTVAKRLTGTEQPEKALERLTLDPQLQVKFQEALLFLLNVKQLWRK